MRAEIKPTSVELSGIITGTEYCTSPVQSFSITSYSTFFKIKSCFVIIINYHCGLNVVFCSSVVLGRRPSLLGRLCLACRIMSDNGIGQIRPVSYK